MTPKRQLATAAAAVLAGALALTQWPTPPAPAPTMTIGWVATPYDTNLWPGWTYRVMGSTNLVDWYLVTNVPARNGCLKVPIKYGAEFFKLL